MIESDERCGACGNALFLKEFRSAVVLVCQTCGTVKLSKYDFKMLLTRRPRATPPPPQISSRGIARPGVTVPAPAGPVESEASIPPPAMVDSEPSIPPPSAAAPESAHSFELPYDVDMPAGEPSPRSLLGVSDEPSPGSYDEVPHPGYDEDAFVETEETEEFPREPEVGTMFETEVVMPATDENPLRSDEAPIEAFDEPALDTRAFVDAGPRGPSLDAGSDASSYDDDLIRSYRRERRRTMVLGGLAALFLVTVLGAVGGGLTMAGVFDAEDPDLGPRLPDVPEDEEAEGPAPPPGEEEPTDEPEPSKPERPTPVPASPQPTPQPDGAPGPRPVAPSASVLAKRGWQTLESSPDEAERIFQKALDRDSAHADANYGYGYALLKQGRATRATPYLCKAQRAGGEEIRREVRSLLTQNGLACE